MTYPSEPNEPQRDEFVRAALDEASRYEAETDAPMNLVSAAMARYERAGRDCSRPRLTLGRVAPAFGLLLLAGIALRWQISPHLTTGGSGQKQAVVDPSTIKAVLPISSVGQHLDIAQSALPPIDIEQWAFTDNTRNRRRISGYGARHRRHTHFARRLPSSVQAKPSLSVWKTETVQVEVVTQTVTPVWVAQADPATATIALTPALFQVALCPEEDADTPASAVAAQLIPVRFEQENTQP